MWEGDKRVFRTYIKGKDKKSTESHKNLPGRTFEDASQFDSFGAELNEGFVDISFDTKEEFEAFLDMADKNKWCCLALESQHGGHTFWKDSENHIKKGGKEIRLAVGFLSDIHGGATYIPLRVNGVDRQVRYELEEGEDYQEVPPELYPIKTDVVLWGMGSGDGRNEDLSKIVFALHNQLCLDKDTIKGILKNANRFVLKDSLEESELDTILRDETFDKMKPNFYGNNGKFLLSVFSKYMKQKYNLKVLNGVLCVYSKGVYKSENRVIVNLIRDEIPNITPAKIKEALQDLYFECDEVEPANARFIGFRNGVLDIVTMELLPFNPDLVVTNCIPWDFVPSAYSKDVDEMLNRISCNDEEIRKLLEECIGYCFYRKNIFKKAFIFTGSGNNGKSTFLDCIVNVIGEQNVSALDLKELGDRFSTAMLYGKLLNAGDDISDDFIQDSALFKKIVSGDRIKGERKGEDPFDFNPFVKLVFCVNNMPRIKDKTGAVKNRLIPIPFNARFDESDKDYNPNIRQDLMKPEAMQYFIVLGIEGLKRLLKSNRFTQSAKVEKELSDYEIYNNPVLGFVQEIMEEDGENALVCDTVSSIYARYQVYCNENGFQAESRTQFARSMKVRFNLESVPRKVKGKSVRMFQPVKDSLKIL